MLSRIFRTSRFWEYDGPAPQQRTYECSRNMVPAIYFANYFEKKPCLYERVGKLLHSPSCSFLQPFILVCINTYIIYKYIELQEWWIKYETSRGYRRRELSRRVVNHCATGMISITILWHLLWKPSAYAVFRVPQRHFLNHNLSS